MPFGIKGLTINIKSLIGGAFSLRVLTTGLVLVLVLLLVGAVVYWRRIPEIDWQFLLGRLAIERPVEEREEKEEGEEEFPVSEVETPDLERKYTEAAQAGEGVTHLARRALKSYLEEKGNDFNLTVEHKIYIEDHIKDRTGDGWLMPGETLTFSEELIVEAINKAQELTPDHLENLKQYSALVTSL